MKTNKPFAVDQKKVKARVAQLKKDLKASWEERNMAYRMWLAALDYQCELSDKKSEAHDKYQAILKELEILCSTSEK